MKQKFLFNIMMVVITILVTSIITYPTKSYGQFAVANAETGIAALDNDATITDTEEAAGKIDAEGERNPDDIAAVEEEDMTFEEAEEAFFESNRDYCNHCWYAKKGINTPRFE